MWCSSPYRRNIMGMMGGRENLLNARHGRAGAFQADFFHAPAGGRLFSVCTAYDATFPFSTGKGLMSFFCCAFSARDTFGATCFCSGRFLEGKA